LTQKKDSEDTDFPDSSVWLWDVDNDKKMGKKINACEVWIWRKMQRISWMEKKTNESVHMEIGIEEDEMLQQTALRRKLGFFGRVMRSDGLEKRMMLAYGDGRRRRGRPRRKWMDEKHEVRGHPFMMSTKKSGFDPHSPCPHGPDPLPLVDVHMRST